MRRNRWLVLVLVVSLLLSGVDTTGLCTSETASASEDTSEESISFSFEDGVLTFVGSGELSFEGAYTSSPWYQYKDSTTKIVFDDEITEICAGAFRDFSVLAEIEWPSELRTIGDFAFENCGLKKVSIPDELDSWGMQVFSSCSKLEEVEIGSYKGSNFTMWNGNPFYKDTKLHTITVSENHKYLSVKDNVLYYCSETVSGKSRYLLTYPAGDSRKEYHIPDGVTRVGTNAFAHAKYLEKITMSDSVTFLDVRAFSYMQRLKAIQLSNGLEHICNSICMYCYQLEEVTLPRNVKKISGAAFKDTNIKQITLPSSVVELEIGVFDGCYNLSQIIAYNKDMLIQGEPDSASSKITLCGYKGGSLQRYAEEHSLTFQEIEIFPIEISQEIFDNFDVTVDGQIMDGTELTCEGKSVQLQLKSDAPIVAVGINNDEIGNLDEGILSYTVDKPISISKVYNRKEIHNEQEFVAIFDEDTGNTIYSLESDITLTDWVVPCHCADEQVNKAAAFEGVLEGNDHTITLDGVDTVCDKHCYGSLMVANYGIVRNCQILCQDVNAGSSSFSTVCWDNYGVIEQFDVTGSMTGYSCYGITYNNRGRIQHCSVDCIITGKNDAAGIACSNYELLSNNEVDGVITSRSQNAAGICDYNQSCALTEVCTNKAQVSSVRAAGISVYNNGYIRDCTNLGTIAGIEKEGDIAVESAGKIITSTPSPSPTASPSPSPTATPSPSPTATPSPSPTATPSPSPTATPSPSPTATSSPSPDPGPSVDPSPSEAPSLSPSQAATPSPSPTASVSPIPSAGVTPRPVGSKTPAPTTPQGSSTLSKPDKLKNVSVKQTSKCYAQLRWEKRKDVSFQIWRSTGTNKKYRLLAKTGNKNTYTDIRVKGGKTYYYKVVAINKFGLKGDLSKATEVKIKISWLPRPTILLKKGKKDGNRYVEVVLSKYKGTYADIQVKRGKKYIPINVQRRKISAYKGKYRLVYQKKGIYLYFRVRTWKRVNGKKRYSPYSKPKKIRT